MYRVRMPRYDKRDPVMRWGLPDRVFFACGACHILAHAFLARYPKAGATALWLRPDPPFRHGHIVAATAQWVFDYHGYVERGRYLAHTLAKARRWWPGYGFSLEILPPEILVSEAASRAIAGLWLRQPDQFLHDALPRAQAYLDRVPGPPVAS